MQKQTILVEMMPPDKPPESSSICFFVCFLVLFFVSLGPHMQHMDVPRLGVQFEPQPGLHQSHRSMGSEPRLQPTPQQHQILNTLSKARDQTHALMGTSQVC